MAMASRTHRTDVSPLTPVTDTQRWFLALVMLATVFLGWYWPVIGFVVPLSMLAGIGGSFLRGRYVCGNLCPRGSFFDTFYRFVGGNRPTPLLFSNLFFRWGVLAVLMSFMALQIAENPSDPMHWGRVFWEVCVATTIAGLLLGRVYRARTWCAFCPVGTMANAIGGSKDQLTISGCKGCGSCEKSCPMDFTIAVHSSAGVLPHRDCLKCSSCVRSCHTGALSFAATTKAVPVESLSEKPL